jgi:hypothetical protein
MSIFVAFLAACFPLILSSQVSSKGGVQAHQLITANPFRRLRRNVVSLSPLAWPCYLAPLAPRCRHHPATRTGQSIKDQIPEILLKRATHS